MKEKLIKYWERKEHQMDIFPKRKDVYFAHAFGALDFAMDAVNNLNEETEMMELWESEWKARLEGKIYG